MPISSPGLGSGLDVNSIVSQLVALERRPIEQLQAQKAKLDTQLSSIGLLQSYMANVQSAAGQLGKTDWWTKNVASSSEPTAVGVSALAGAFAASYSMEVISLATALQPAQLLHPEVHVPQTVIHRLQADVLAHQRAAHVDPLLVPPDSPQPVPLVLLRPALPGRGFVGLLWIQFRRIRPPHHRRDQQGSQARCQGSAATMECLRRRVLARGGASHCQH